MSKLDPPLRLLIAFTLMAAPYAAFLGLLRRDSRTDDFKFWFLWAPIVIGLFLMPSFRVGRAKVAFRVVFAIFVWVLVHYSLLSLVLPGD